MIFNRSKLAVCLLGLFLVSLFSSFPAHAQSFNAYDLIAAVNSLRASQGLSPYEVDAWLMDYAQQHSNYQASINSSTHTHKDGSNSLSIGAMENIASGTASLMTVDFIVNQIWADAVHMKTMVGYSSGTVGAGLATSGDSVYITLNVKPGGASAVSGSAQASAIPATAKPLYTSTPAADGSISHTVGYGEALWSIAIAYGVKINTLRELNNLAVDSNTIYVGQKLLVIPAGTIIPTEVSKPGASLTPTFTLTPKPPTITPTMFSTHTPTVSPTATKKPLLSISFQPNPRNLGIGIIVIASIALVFIVFFGFIKK